MPSTMSSTETLVQESIAEYEAEHNQKLTEEEITALRTFADELERRVYGFPATLTYMERTGVFGRQLSREQTTFS